MMSVADGDAAVACVVVLVAMAIEQGRRLRGCVRPKKILRGDANGLFLQIF
jgi:hypothetical protein